MPARRPLEERFWEKVEKGDGCWRWTAAHNGEGYGSIGTGEGKGMVLAHRLSYELAHGPIPEGKWALHRCDNPRCVNPDHLFLGDNADNVRDMRSKGRGTSILKAEEAVEIYVRSAAGEKHVSLAAEYGVRPATVKGISLGRSWATHLEAVRDTPRARKRGCQNPETAYAILWRCASGGETRKQVADAYGVTIHVVKDIVSRRRWKFLSQLHD